MELLTPVCVCLYLVLTPLLCVHLKGSCSTCEVAHRPRPSTLLLNIAGMSCASKPSLVQRMLPAYLRSTGIKRPRFEVGGLTEFPLSLQILLATMPLVHFQTHPGKWSEDAQPHVICSSSCVRCNTLRFCGSGNNSTPSSALQRVCACRSMRADGDGWVAAFQQDTIIILALPRARFASLVVFSLSLKLGSKQFATHT